MRIGKIFELKTNNILGNEIEEDEEEFGNNIRPEINGEYEQELLFEKSLFKYVKLRINEKLKFYESSELLFIYKMIKYSENDIKAEIKEFEEKCSLFKNYSSKSTYLICRIYLLNISNIIIDDLRGKKGILKIKNQNGFSQYESDQEFDLVPGEINQIVVLHLKWPVKDFKNLLKF